MKNEIFVSPRVSVKAVNKFFKTISSGIGEIHAVEIYQNDGLLMRISPAPYQPTDKREIYSLSKSFTSTAIGFLCDEKKLSEEDYIKDIFPDKLPEKVSENLEKMQIKHILSMNTGHDSCAMSEMVQSGDAARAFLAKEVKFEPGTHFVYNTGATCMLSCVTERITGMKLLDFLTWKLFMPLGISGVRWNSVPDGTNEGGCGIHVSCDDIAKLGLLYLHKGVWNGKRILSEKWVETATHQVSDNSGNGTPDWCAGYGYQFWMNSREGFRGDGAFGQLCIVLPERNMVVAVQAELGDMQAEIDAVMELVYHLYDNDEPEPLILPDYTPAESKQLLSGLEGKYYKLEKNPMGWSGVYFIYDSSEAAVSAVFSNGTDQYTVKAGSGRLIESYINVKNLTPKLLGLMSAEDVETNRLASSYRAEEGKLIINSRVLNTPHKMEITFISEADKLRIHVEGWGKIISSSTELAGTLC